MDLELELTEGEGLVVLFGVLDQRAEGGEFVAFDVDFEDVDKLVAYDKEWET